MVVEDALDPGCYHEIVKQRKKQPCPPIMLQGNQLPLVLVQPKIEFSNRVLGRNRSLEAQCKTKVNCFFNDQLYVCRKLDRDQQDIYKLQLHLHKQMKKVHRENWEHQREEERAKAREQKLKYEAAQRAAIEAKLAEKVEEIRLVAAAAAAEKTRQEEAEAAYQEDEFEEEAAEEMDETVPGELPDVEEEDEDDPTAALAALERMPSLVRDSSKVLEVTREKTNPRLATRSRENSLVREDGPRTPSPIQSRHPTTLPVIPEKKKLAMESLGEEEESGEGSEAGTTAPNVTRNVQMSLRKQAKLLDDVDSGLPPIRETSNMHGKFIPPKVNEKRQERLQKRDQQEYSRPWRVVPKKKPPPPDPPLDPPPLPDLEAEPEPIKAKMRRKKTEIKGPKRPAYMKDISDLTEESVYYMYKKTEDGNLVPVKMFHKVPQFDLFSYRPTYQRMTARRSVQLRLTNQMSDGLRHSDHIASSLA